MDPKPTTADLQAIRKMARAGACDLWWVFGERARYLGRNPPTVFHFRIGVAVEVRFTGSEFLKMCREGKVSRSQPKP